MIKLHTILAVGVVAMASGGSLNAADQAATTTQNETVVLRTDGIKYAYPRWSNDGSHIIYQSNESGLWQVYTADREGNHVAQVTDGDANNYFPDWSPDNSMIAFVSDRDGNEEVYAMHLDGSGLTNLSQSEARDIHPYWTPGGQKIVFNSTRSDSADWSLDLFEVNVDGSHLVQLTNTPDVETCARVAPDGERLVYLKMSSSTNTDDICLRDGDGTERLLTSDASRDGWPAWAPDGNRVVYSSMIDGRFCLVEQDIGSGETRILSQPDGGVSDCRAQYSPDGTELLFNRDIDDSTIAIVRMKLR